MTDFFGSTGRAEIEKAVGFIKEVGDNPRDTEKSFEKIYDLKKSRREMVVENP